jgi:nitrous oxidase accessory protein NosD
MRRFRLFLLVLVLFMVVQSLEAATYYVGSCKSGSYSTIQAAVSGVPAGSTIDVCPGTYAEQVAISQSLTLQGISYKNSSQAVITIPSSGLATTSIIALGTVAAQVNVTAGDVDISNIIVDGTAGSTSCPTVDYIGILYSGSASGTVKEVETRNQNCSESSGGLGIVAVNEVSTPASITIEDNNINTNNYAGILVSTEQPLGTFTAAIENNYIASSGEGVETLGFAEGSVSDNVIVPGSTGIYAAAVEISVSGNTLTGGGVGIYIGAQISVTSNHISSTAQGIFVPQQGATIENNAISQSGIGIEFACSVPTTVKGNTVNGASVGFDSFPSASTGANKFYNAATISTDGCGS